MPSIYQNNKYGDNHVYLSQLEIDVGWLQSVIFDEPDTVTSLLKRIEEHNNQANDDGDDENYDTTPMEDIAKKNEKNDLIEFYEEFIQEHESKFEVLEEFIKEQELASDVEEASKAIRRAIYSYCDRMSFKLTPQLFHDILTKFTEPLSSPQEKSLMELWIYFLYRYCFIGEK